MACVANSKESKDAACRNGSLSRQRIDHAAGWDDPPDGARGPADRPRTARGTRRHPAEIARGTAHV